MEKHIARCQCGNVNVECVGESKYVGMCSCDDCQRRTGSAFSLTSWFDKSNVKITGKVHVYSLTEHNGIETNYSFCPNCSSTVFFEIPRNPSGLGVSVGCFTDQNFAQPTVSFYEAKRLPWIVVPKGINRVIAEGGSEKVSD
ncbi:MAG: aldehyde-activating protein [Fluviicola sp.]|nr:MAG: aldehyde-activating protein [Fluviicola sp.]